MEKLKMHAPNLTDGNIARIRELFPGCVTEARDESGALKLAVDFDQLKQELSDSIVEGLQERYHLNWPGKREALLTANAPIAKTLRPCREESVDFDTTKNLFIEGDNLDALKLLQETYLGKVKMIYIDPPYNTGNDFIYEDDFAENADKFLLRSNQKDEEGNRLVANTESNGRFHSDWLSMMYSRLKLARNLLRDDGVIFISIDDNEVSNLRKLCDEIFGSENFVAVFPWKKRTTKSDVPFGVSQDYEWVITFTKAKLQAGVAYERKYYETIDFPNDRWRLADLTKQTSADERPNSAFVMVDPKTGKKYAYNQQRVWAVTEDTFPEYYRKGKIVFPDDYDFLNMSIPAFRVFESEDKEKAIKKFGTDKAMKAVSTFLPKEIGMNEGGNKEMVDLFGGKLFSFPKPVSFIKYFVSVINDTSAIVLDFFAGSSTTAHAVMQLNAEDGGNRKFIMVQLPELCNEQSEAFKAGYKTIAKISKERIRRAGKKIFEGECHNHWKNDIGFRVLKIDSSNMAEVYYTPDAVNQGDLFNAIDNIKPDRTPEDLLFQVLLDAGVDLSLPIRKETIQGKTVFFVDENALVACFDTDVNEELVRELAQFRSYDMPIRKMVFRDNGFASDAVKINVEQIFRQLSPGTEVKSI
jgi:adenine-specific DNA-methyltransferase